MQPDRADGLAASSMNGRSSVCSDIHNFRGDRSGDRRTGPAISGTRPLAVPEGGAVSSGRLARALLHRSTLTQQACW